MVDIFPVDGPEECMTHDFLGICWARSKAKLRFPSQKLLKDRDRVSRHVDRVKGLIGKNGVVDFVLVFTAEWRLLEKHLVY